jgi:hypothetical protein
MVAAGEVKIPIDDSFTDTVCNYGAGFIKLQYRVGTAPVGRRCGHICKAR